MKKINKLLLLIVFIMSLQLRIYASENINSSISIKINDLFELIKKNNIEIINKRENLKYTKYQIDEVKSVSRPDIKFETNMTRYKNETFNEPGPFNNYDYKISFIQPLFTYGKISSAIKASKHYYKNAEHDYNITEKDFILNAVQLYYTIKLLDHQKNILLSTEKTYFEHLENTKIRFEAGDVTNVDYLSAKVNYEQIKPQIISVDNKIYNLKNELKLLLNIDMNQNIIIIDDIKISNIDITKNNINFFESALKNDERIAKLEESIKILELQKTIAKNSLRPSINLIANYGGSADDLGSMLKKESENALIGINLTFPLFDGYKSKNQVAEFEIQIQSNIRSLNLMRNTLKKDIENKLNDIDHYKKQIKSNELLLEQSEEAFRISNENYKAGASINLDVIESEKNRLTARLALIESKYNYLICIYQLKRLAGIDLSLNEF
ncbi:TolC family protein [Candidatus Dependentiae bacterium]|nr:TolC family protein [Candidatus Dependentiae bacterium]